MTYNDDDRAREVIALRAQWVDGYVGRAIARAGRPVTTAEMDEWTDHGYRVWRETHPALNALLPTHEDEAVA